MSKSANLYAHIGQEVKEQGTPFEVNLTEEHRNISRMTDEQLNAELEKGYADMQAGQTIPVSEAFADIRGEYSKL